MTRISAIVAMGNDRVIGNADNAMPWHLPADLRHFREKTMGKPIIMGRKTYESIGRPLPGRHNIVLTRDASFKADGVTVASDPAAAIAAAGDADEIMITGGAAVYSLFMPQVNYLYLTFIDGDFEGTAYFPQWEEDDWQLLGCEHHEADDKNPHSYTFVEMQRRA